MQCDQVTPECSQCVRLGKACLALYRGAFVVDMTSKISGPSKECKTPPVKTDSPKEVDPWSAGTSAMMSRVSLSVQFSVA